MENVQAMHLVFVILHIVVCIALIALVLLQTGKGAEIGAVFGGSSQTLFGSSGGSTFFKKLTTGVAIIFLVTSFILASGSGQYTTESVMKGMKPAATDTSESQEPPVPAAEKSAPEASEKSPE
ncbi:MAG: preprotein translocase subunit SecG [Syntrophobacteria bacterium]